MDTDALRAQIITTAKKLKRTHERSAEIYDQLADHEDRFAERRRLAANRARAAAQQEAEHLEKLGDYPPPPSAGAER